LERISAKCEPPRWCVLNGGEKKRWETGRISRNRDYKRKRKGFYGAPKRVAL